MHALLSPSAAHRWAICHGSVYLTKNLPNKSSTAAETGTLGHSLAEQVLLGKPLADAVEAELDNPLLTQDLIAAAALYVDTARQYAAPQDKLHVEIRLPIESITGEEGAHGTADLLIESDILTVIDAKFGRSPVFAEDNYQLKIYALAAARKLNYKGNILTVIIQPTIGHVSEQFYHTDELEAFALDLTKASELTLLMAEGVIAPKYTPDPKACHWCQGKALCPALAEQMFNVMDSKEMTLSEKANWIDTARKWADALEDMVLETLQDGKEVEGWYLTVGRPGNRKWIDEKVAIEVLGDNAWVQTLISPTKAEAFLNKEMLGSLCYREPGKPVAKQVKK